MWRCPTSALYPGTAQLPPLSFPPAPQAETNLLFAIFTAPSSCFAIVQPQCRCLCPTADAHAKQFLWWGENRPFSHLIITKFVFLLHDIHRHIRERGTRVSRSPWPPFKRSNGLFAILCFLRVKIFQTTLRWYYTMCCKSNWWTQWAHLPWTLKSKQGVERNQVLH